MRRLGRVRQEDLIALDGGYHDAWNMKAWQIALLVVGGIGLGTCALCVAVVGKATSDVQAKNAPPSASEAPATEVTADQMYEAYHANEVAADERFKDKAVLVTGLVDSIDKDVMDNMVVQLRAGGSALLGVRATIDPTEKAKVAALSKGSTHGFLCKGSGMIMGSPGLRACLVK